MPISIERHSFISVTWMRSPKGWLCWNGKLSSLSAKRAQALSFPILVRQDDIYRLMNIAIDRGVSSRRNLHLCKAYHLILLGVPHLQAEACCNIRGIKRGDFRMLQFRKFLHHGRKVVKRYP